MLPLLPLRLPTSCALAQAALPLLACCEHLCLRAFAPTVTAAWLLFPGVPLTGSLTFLDPVSPLLM